MGWSYYLNSLILVSLNLILNLDFLIICCLYCFAIIAILDSNYWRFKLGFAIIRIYFVISYSFPPLLVLLVYHNNQIQIPSCSPHNYFGSILLLNPYSLPNYFSTKPVSAMYYGQIINDMHSIVDCLTYYYRKIS